MCRNFLLYLISLETFSFLKKVTSRQQGLYIAFVLILGIIGLNFIEYIYHSKGIIKLFIFLVLILFLTGGILNGLKITMDSQGDLQNKYMAIYYCIQFAGIIIALIFFIFKFLKLTFFLISSI